MSMLARYQKAGGFMQILQLIETCGTQKQDNFLQMIEKENPHWAAAIREKMLTIEKVFSWDSEVIAEISARLQQLTLATAMHGLTPEKNENLLRTYTHSQRRNIEDLHKSKEPTPAEITSAFLKILQEVRTMIKDNELRIEKFAPTMVIDKEIEDKLSKLTADDQSANESSMPDLSGFGSNASPTATSAVNSDAEMFAMRKRVQALVSENNQLKTELRILRDKLTQIRKIA